MKAGIHPVYKNLKFKCVCGNIIETRSAIESAPASDGYYHLEICAACHPFFTGKQKLMDKAGRVERFRRRYEKPEETAVRTKKAAEEQDAENAEKAEKAEADLAEKAEKTAKFEMAEKAAKAQKAADRAEKAAEKAAKSEKSETPQS